MKIVTGAIVTIIALGAISYGSAKGAEFMTGKALLRLCEDKTPHGYSPGICIGYVSGASDQMDGFRGSALPELNYCLPNNVTTGQLRDVAVKFLKEHPEKLDQQASYLMFEALTNAFPCAAN